MLRGANLLVAVCFGATLVACQVRAQCGARWTPATPLARLPGGFGYDPNQNIFLMYGGIIDGFEFDDLWTWDGQRWARWVQNPLGRRYRVTLGFDPLSQRWLLIGGLRNRGRGDAWTWTPGDWQPHGRWDGDYLEGDIQYDPLDGVTRIYRNGSLGGFQLWDGSQIVGVEFIYLCSFCQFAYAPADDSFLVYGGGAGDLLVRWDRTDAVVLTPASLMREKGTLGYDAVTNRAYIAFGQRNGNNRTNMLMFDGQDWSSIPAAADVPGRHRAAGWFDSTAGTFSVIGGLIDDHRYEGSFWRWDGAAWSMVQDSPSRRTFAAMAYDAQRQAAVMFGGLASSGGSDLGDTWLHRDFIWTQADATGPSPRSRHAMAYDAARGVTVLFGGTSGANETWEWDGAWTLVREDGPPPRFGHAMCFDMARGVTVLFGGTGADAGTWEWDGQTWRLVATDGPQPRVGAAMAYDPEREVSVLVGATADGGDCWEWDGVAWALRSTGAPCDRRRHAMAYVPNLGGIVLVGGSGGGWQMWRWNGQHWDAMKVDSGNGVLGDTHAMCFDEANGQLLMAGGNALMGHHHASYHMLPNTRPGDVDLDAAITLDDLLRLLQHYGTSRGTAFGDIDRNGVIDMSDLLELLARFGESC